METGIRYLDYVEKDILIAEGKIRGILKSIADEVVPSARVNVIFMRRGAERKLNASLSKLGDALGVVSASKREIQGDLSLAQEGLFSNQAGREPIGPHIDPETGEVVDPEIVKICKEFQDGIPVGDSVTLEVPGKKPVTIQGTGEPDDDGQDDDGDEEGEEEEGDYK